MIDSLNVANRRTTYERGNFFSEETENVAGVGNRLNGKDDSRANAADERCNSFGGFFLLRQLEDLVGKIVERAEQLIGY